MGQYTFSQYFRDQWNKLPIPKPIDDVSSKTILVTGSNVGLGFEASVHLADMRPKVLFATCRNQAKCEQTREWILKRVGTGGAPDSDVRALPLEMGSFEGVRTFVDQFAADGNGALHTLVANAGMGFTHYTQTPDGWETMLQVNYLSTALLSILLLPHLIASSTPDSPSRLVIVSSFGHFFHKLKGVDSWNNILETVNKPECDDGARYPIAKLLCIMFIRELASRLPEPTPVIACSVNPGYCKSNIFRTPMSRFFSAVLGKAFLIRTTEEGSRTVVHAAVASDRSMHGHYLSCCQVAEETDFVFTPEGKAFSAKVWDETITILSGVDGRVTEIVEKYLRTNPT